MDFSTLINQIDQTHQTLQQKAVKAVNSHIALRNWLIGYYIVEFEQNGEDRAKYGAKLFYKLAITLKSINIKTNERDLRMCRNFYNILFIDKFYFLFTDIQTTFKNYFTNSGVSAPRITKKYYAVSNPRIAKCCKTRR